MGIAMTDEQKREARKDMSLAAAVGFNIDEALVSLQDQIDALPQDGSVDHDAMADDAVGGEELTDAFADLVVVPTWGTPGAEAGNKIEVVCQLKDAKGEDLAAQRVFDVHVADTEYGDDSASATISDAAVPIGTILSGDGTAAVRVRTDAAGQIALEVSEVAAASRYLSIRPCYGSPWMDPTDTVELAFT